MGDKVSESRARINVIIMHRVVENLHTQRVVEFIGSLHAVEHHTAGPRSRE